MLPIVITTLRILVASIFLLYGMEKLVNPSILRVTLARYLPKRASSIAAPVLPVVEVGLGLGLLFGLAMPFSAIVTGALLLLFTAMLVKSWRAESGKSDCGCSAHTMTIRLAVLRNVVLIVATLAVILLPTARASSFLLLLEAGVAALIVGAVAFLARRQPVIRAVVSAKQESGEREHHNENENTPIVSRRGALIRAGRFGMILGVLALQPLFNAGQVLAAPLGFANCQLFNWWYERVCNCGVTDVYKCGYYCVLNSNKQCVMGCYTYCYEVDWYEGC